jgi:hypothetical protein
VGNSPKSIGGHFGRGREKRISNKITPAGLGGSLSDGVAASGVSRRTSALFLVSATAQKLVHYIYTSSFPLLPNLACYVNLSPLLLPD